MRYVIVIVCCFAVVFADKPCVSRSFGESSIVCVCNATYCDTIDHVTDLSINGYLKVTTNKDGLRFHKEEGALKRTNDVAYIRDGANAVTFRVQTSKRYQEILGFGAAFTDSAGINLHTLSTASQTNLLKSYYSSEGIEYNIGRVPIAGTDFSTYPYSYDDVPGDVELEHFALVEEDLVHKIPVILEATKLRDGVEDGNHLNLFASPWSAPAWMKTNNKTNGGGFLFKEYQPIWAQYFLRFLEEYNKLGVNFWALTIQNEPTAAVVPNYAWNCMGWSPWGEAVFVNEYLGPTLNDSIFSDIILISMDDQRFSLPFWGLGVFENQEAAKWYKGVAIHWYWDKYFGPWLLDNFHEKYPDYFMFYSEACEEDKPALGRWSLAENYAQNILEDLTHHVGGWMDWNFALNMEGGPNWAENYVDASIIIDETKDEFYKQPSFYALGHFSKFLPRSTKRIVMTSTSEHDLQYGAFLTPAGHTVAIILNFSDDETSINIEDNNGNAFTTIISQNSINTILW